MMLRRYQLAGLAVAAAMAAAPAHAVEFLKAIDDVPLVAGLTEQPEPTVFESDQGRVVRTVAEGQVSGGEITSFYFTTLPALGWKRIDADNMLSFERGNERLNIEVREYRSSRPIEVKFELIVKLASTKLPE